MTFRVQEARKVQLGMDHLLNFISFAHSFEKRTYEQQCRCANILILQCSPHSTF